MDKDLNQPGSSDPSEPVESPTASPGESSGQVPDRADAAPSGEPGAADHSAVPEAEAERPETQPELVPQPPTEGGEVPADEPGPSRGGLQEWAAAWQGHATATTTQASGQVRAGNLVVEGILAGAENYLLSACQGLRLLDRLRMRSLRIAALRDIVARRVGERLELSLVFNSGDRFVLAGAPPAGWEETLHGLQREFDIWLFQHLHPAGLVRCELAGAVCEGDMLPLEGVARRRHQRHLQPLEGALRVGLRWHGRAFVLPAGPNIGECTACGAVTTIHRLGDLALCDDCAHDLEIGERYPRLERAWLCPENQADVSGPGLGLRFSEPQAADGTEVPLDSGLWPLARALPAGADAERSLAGLAVHAPGTRKYLGYLRIELDRPKAAFAELNGDPARIAALARLLEEYFNGWLARAIAARFPTLLALSASAHGVLLIGAWHEALDAALRMHREFHKLVGGALTLSAGLALVPPEIEVRQGAADAALALSRAHQAGGSRLDALGSLLDWPHAAQVVPQAKKLAAWVRQRAISAGWLGRLARAYEESVTGHGSRAQVVAALHDARIRYGPARGWASRLISADAPEWPWMTFLARYAALAGSALAAHGQPPEAPALADETPGEPPVDSEPASEDLGPGRTSDQPGMAPDAATEETQPVEEQ